VWVTAVALQKLLNKVVGFVSSVVIAEVGNGYIINNVTTATAIC